MFRIAGTAVLCACAFAQGDPGAPDAVAQAAISSRDEANFGQVLEDIVRASKDRFRRVEGARVENRRRDYYYEAKFYLPGATYCQILLEKNGPIYNCEWEKAPDRGGFATLFDQLVSKIENALGADWSRKAGTRKSGKEVLFTKAKEPVVQVIRETGASAVHVFITPTATSPTGIGEHLPKRPPFIFP